MKSPEFLLKLSERWKGENNPRYGATTRPLKGFKHSLELKMGKVKQ